MRRRSGDDAGRLLEKAIAGTVLGGLAAAVYYLWKKVVAFRERKTKRPEHDPESKA